MPISLLEWWRIEYTDNAHVLARVVINLIEYNLDKCDYSREQIESVKETLFVESLDYIENCIVKPTCQDLIDWYMLSAKRIARNKYPEHAHLIDERACWNVMVLPQYKKRKRPSLE